QFSWRNSVGAIQLAQFSWRNSVGYLNRAKPGAAPAHHHGHLVLRLSFFHYAERVHKLKHRLAADIDSIRFQCEHFHSRRRQILEHYAVNPASAPQVSHA
ncbi:MAG: hypothetical protein OSA89_19035, partial [Mariniblastus sp.]|nr:hypothetical protein [Mariniblastus sp.]